MVFTKFIHEKCYFNKVATRKPFKRPVLSCDVKMNWGFRNFITFNVTFLVINADFSKAGD